MKELTMYNANYLKVRLEDGSVSYIEAQEHCDIWWRTPECGVAGDYYMYRDSKRICFNYRVEDKCFYCDILAYSHDYGKTWVEVE